MASDQVVLARDVLRALSEIKRLGAQRVLEDLEKQEVDLTEFMLEEVCGIHRQILKAGVPSKEARLTMVNRTSPELPAKLVFTDTEIQLLEHLVPAKYESRKRTVGDFLIRLARLGGYLNRKRDAPPGTMVLWRGMARLTDIHLGYSMARDVGN